MEYDKNMEFSGPALQMRMLGVMVYLLCTWQCNVAAIPVEQYREGAAGEGAVDPVPK